MKIAIRSAVFLACLSMFWANQTAKSQPTSPPHYKVTNTYSLPGVGYFGFVAVDPQTRRVYVPHGNQVQIIDADTGKLEETLPDTPTVKGIALAPDLKRAFTSNEGDGTITIFNTETFQAIKKVDAYRPDYIFFDPFSKRVFPLHDTTTVINGETGEHVADLDFGGAAEQAVSDGKGRVYVTVAEGDYVAVVDPVSVKIINKYQFTDGECPGPVSLSFDQKRDHLFVGCANGIHVIQASTGHTIGHVYTCKSDQTAVDPSTGSMYEACWDGTISVIDEVESNHYAVVDTLWIGKTARALGFDLVTKKLFVPTVRIDEVKTDNPDRPLILTSKEGSFTVTVAEPDSHR
jgi:DNA-binding beta-propeller fold protein YncE